MNWVIAAIIVVLLLLAFRLARLATRLDRLHRRTEAAWAALDVTLARRSGIARAFAAGPGFDPEVSAAVAAAARATENATRPHRADTENELTRALEHLGAAPESSVAAELQQSADRIMLARRFYNDAVRDTRALRADRFSRMFRLAGRAELPDYFEIAEYDPAAPLVRVSARVILLDDDDRVLLFSGSDPELGARSQFWFTPGGGVEPGEDLVAAAQRELREETGLRLRPADFTGPLWWRRTRFRFSGVEYEQTEYFFVTRLMGADGISHEGFTEVERGYITGHGWFSAAGLAAADEVIYPIELAARLPEAVAVVRSGWSETDAVRID